MGLSLDRTIFNGFRLLNTVKQNRLNRKASVLEEAAARQDLVLNVTLSYLQALNGKAVLNVTKQGYETSKKPLQI